MDSRLRRNDKPAVYGLFGTLIGEDPKIDHPTEGTVCLIAGKIWVKVSWLLNSTHDEIVFFVGPAISRTYKNHVLVVSSL